MHIITKGYASKKHKKAIEAFLTGNYKEAKKDWEDFDGDILALKGLAFIALHENQTREARSFFEELLDSAALDPEIYNGLALTYLAEGKNPQAIDILLDAMETVKAPLLSDTLEKIRTSKGLVSIAPLMVVTMPASHFNPLGSISLVLKKLGPRLWWILSPLLLLLVFFAYPYTRNFVVSLDIRNRGRTIPVRASIAGINEILAARENRQTTMSRETAKEKVEELRELIASKKPNKARILVNEILASNAPEVFKERAYILEGFIAEADYENIDYIPSYKEIATTPALYNKTLVRWQGVAANLKHQGRSKTYFDLLIGYKGTPVVDGIAYVEVEGMKELFNGQTLTVVGAYQGFTSDNKIIITAYRVIPQ